MIAALAVLVLTACHSAPPLPIGERPGRQFEPMGPPKATIIAVHGFNDYSSAFEAFGKFAAANGYFVDAYDQQGFGQNANFGNWPGRETLIDDLRARISERRAQAPDRPLYVLGHSMGGAVSTLALAAGSQSDVDGVVLVAPAVWGGDAFNPFYRATLWAAARVAPNWTLSGKSLGIQASDNKEVLLALGEDPLFIKETRIRAMEGVVDVMGSAREAGPQLELPRLILSGVNDEVIPPAAINSFVLTLEPAGCRHVVYDQGWHLLLRDLQREVVWQDILLWLGGPADSDIGVSCDTVLD